MLHVANSSPQQLRYGVRQKILCAYLVCLVVEDAGDLPGEDEEVPRWKQVDEGVEVEGNVGDV